MPDIIICSLRLRPGSDLPQSRENTEPRTGNPVRGSACVPKRRCKGAFCLKTAAALDSLSAAQESPLEELLPAGLPERDRQVLLWRYGRRLDYGQIAIRLGISEVACRSRISRALARCRSVF